MKKFLYTLLLIIGTAYADENAVVIFHPTLLYLKRETAKKYQPGRLLTGMIAKHTGLMDLLRRGDSNDYPKLSSLDRLSQIMENQLAVGQFISADLVSENVGERH